MKEVRFTQYMGVISARVYDTELKKNTGKIDILELERYLTKQLDKAEVIKAERKNHLDIYKFN